MLSLTLEVLSKCQLDNILRCVTISSVNHHLKKLFQKIAVNVIGLYIFACFNTRDDFQVIGKQFGP